MRRTFVLSAMVCFAASLLARSEHVRFAAGGVLLVVVLLKDRKALATAGSFKLWLFPVLFMIVSPFCIGVRGQIPGGIPYSMDQLEKGMLFLFHAYCFVVLGSFVSRTFSIQELIEAAERIGVPQTGLKVALAMAAVKILSRMVSETCSTYRMTRPGWISAMRECHILLGAIVRNATLAAERIAILFYIRNVRIGKTLETVTKCRVGS